MKYIGLTISSFLMAVSNRLMDLLWITLAGLNSDKVMLFGVLLMMGILRIIFSVFAVKPFKSMNFYGKYILGLAAAFIIILIATKSHDNYWILLLVGLNELFGVFQNSGDEDAANEMIVKKSKSASVFKTVEWVAFLAAILLLIFYRGMIIYIYAPLAVLTGLSMILLYNGYSKQYAKKITQEKITDKGTARDILIFNIISGVIITVLYAVIIWVKDSTALYIAWICLIGLMVEFVKKEDYRKNNSLYEGAGLIILALIRYIV
jgi:hypothetical protein